MALFDNLQSLTCREIVLVAMLNNDGSFRLNMNLEIGILGAGIIGLCTAKQVQKNFPNANITLVAEKFNEETTSDGAAGIFRPGHSFTVGSDEITQKIIQDSYLEYDALLKQLPPEVTGVSEISGYIFSNTSKSLVENEFLEKVVPIYRAATGEEIDSCPVPVKYGSYFSTILTECRRLLPFYLNGFRGNVLRKKINALPDFADMFDVTFNCMGLGAKELCSDRKLTPIRGQVIKVSAPWLKNFWYLDYDTYIIPGQDSVTLGGCRQYDSSDLSISRHDTAAILERCYALVPGLVTAPIQRTWVGLRPHRDPVRLEPESLNYRGKKLKIIHNYGHGGYGVTSAPGCAVFAAEMMRELMRQKSRL